MIVPSLISKQKADKVQWQVKFHLIYNLKEACEQAGTIVKPAEHGLDLVLAPNYPLLHYNHTSAPIIALFTPACNASR